MPVKIFFCYAHEDEMLLNKLKGHLKLLQRQGLIDVWHDRDISAGTEWEQEIKEQLNTAQIILLLVSPDFMDSDYCYSVEMKRAIERHKRGDVRVIPIILRPVISWQRIFGQLQVLPRDAQPVISWQNQDEAFFDVAEGILKAVEEVMPDVEVEELGDGKEGVSRYHLLPRALTKPVPNKSDNLWYQPLNQLTQGPKHLQEERNAQNNLFIQTSIDDLFNEAVIAQSNGNLEKAVELYEQVRKLDPNFKKAELTIHLKKLLKQQVSEAKRHNDQESQIKYLQELLKLDPNDSSVRQPLETLSNKYIEHMRKRANSARQSGNWKMEYQSWEEILKLRPAHPEAQTYIKPAHIKYLRQQASKARKAAAWKVEVRKWSELLALEPADTEVKRRLAIAENNLDYIETYENALHSISEGRLDDARETLERLWDEAPFYGDPKRLARKVGILVPLPLKKRHIWLTLLASIVVLVIFVILSVILSVSNSSVAWYIAFMIAVVLLIADSIVLFYLSDYWLLIDFSLDKLFKANSEE